MVGICSLRLGGDILGMPSWFLLINLELVAAVHHSSSGEGDCVLVHCWLDVIVTVCVSAV